MANWKLWFDPAGKAVLLQTHVIPGDNALLCESLLHQEWLSSWAKERQKSRCSTGLCTEEGNDCWKWEHGMPKWEGKM